MISTEVSRHDFESGTSLSSNKRKSIFAMLAFSQRNHLDQIKVINTKYYVVSTPCTENKVKIGQANKYVAFCGRL